MKDGGSALQLPRVKGNEQKRGWRTANATNAPLSSLTVVRPAMQTSDLTVHTHLGLRPDVKFFALYAVISLSAWLSSRHKAMRRC